MCSYANNIETKYYNPLCLLLPAYGEELLLVGERKGNIELFRIILTHKKQCHQAPRVINSLWTYEEDDSPCMSLLFQNLANYIYGIS